MNHNCKETYANSSNSDEKVRASFEKNKLAGFIKATLNGILDFLALGSSTKGWYEKNPMK
jgi:hypothetical protein